MRESEGGGREHEAGGRDHTGGGGGAVGRVARRFARSAGRLLVDGFGALAGIFGVMPPHAVGTAQQWWHDRLGTDAPPPGGPVLPLDEPPPAHPERLVGGVPLTGREEALWAQLVRLRGHKDSFRDGSDDRHDG